MHDLSAEPLGNGPLARLPLLRRCRSGRASSWDRGGGNDDRLHLRPGEERTLAEIPGAGCVRHLWMTLAAAEAQFLRKVVLRAYWDDEAQPSVEVPVGDFFGVGFGVTRNYAALPLAMGPENGRGMACYFPMPFARGARITATSEGGQSEVLLYFYLDYEQYPALEGDWGRFHAQWRRQNPCAGIDPGGMANEEYQVGGSNLSGAGNYVILDAKGWGHYVGCVLNVQNLRTTDQWNWFGEGDDMIFVDGEPFPPSLHGTGTEDYFNMAWCPTQPFAGPYHGMPLVGGPNWSGRWSMYRFHLDDPVHFQRSIRVTIEHGHANRRSDDYSSTAYWYQAEPHEPFPPLPPVEQRLACEGS